MTSEQFRKLPKYAQDKILRLKGNIREFKRLLNDKDQTRVYIEGSPIFGKEDIRKYLPERAIMFDVGKEKSWDNYIEATLDHVEENTVIVRGGGRIKVIPWAANVVKIKLDREGI